MTALPQTLDTSLLSFHPSTAAKWTARILAGLGVLFLTFDTALKVLQLDMAVKSTAEFGYPAGAVLLLGLYELGCLALYLWPRTAPLGALLWTGYLGGAVATHVRLGSPLLTHTLFPLYVAVLLWLPLWLRDPRVRRVLSALTSPSRSAA